MEIDTATPRADTVAGSALPGLPAEGRSALMRYAARLLEGPPSLAGEIVELACVEVAGGLAAETGPVDGGDSPGEPPEVEIDERAMEQLFAAVRRVALGRSRREGSGQHTVGAEGDLPPTATLTQQIERLTPKQREAVYLMFSHGFDYEAIAGITGLTLGNVGFLLHSAVTHLREAAAPTGRVAAADDGRVTDYVLGELNDVARAAFDENVRHDPALKTALAEVRALVAELRGVLERGDEAVVRRKKKTQRANGERWKKWGVLALLVGIVGAAGGGGIWWFSTHAGATQSSKKAPDGEHFQLRPDAWKLADASGTRAADEAKGKRSGGTGAGAARPAVAGGKEDKKLKARPADDVDRIVRADAAGDGAGGTPTAEAGQAPAGGGAAGTESTGAADSSASAGKTGGEAGLAEGSATTATGDASREAPGAAAGRMALAAASHGAAGRAPDGTGKAREPRMGEAGAAGEVADSPSPRRSVAPGADRGLAPAVREMKPARADELRRMVATKRWPAKETVSVPALLEDFPATRIGASDAPEISVSVEVADAPWAPEQRLVLVRLAAAPAKGRPPAAANVVLLVDVSRSMDAPNRLPLVQAAARGLLGELRPEDRVSLVTYAGAARVALGPTPVAEGRAVRAALGALKAEGMTNGSAGLRLAYEVARGGFSVGGVNRVVLCTDGDFNMGVTSEAELAALVEGEAKGGIGLAVYGFGRGRSIDARLEALAVKGGGGSGNVNTRREGERRLAAEANGWRGAALAGVRVEFDCDPTEVAACRLVGYDENFLTPQDAGRRSAESAALAPGETLTALFEMIPAQGGRGAEGKGVGGVTLRVGYRSTAPDVARELRVAVSDTGKTWGEASAEFKFSSTVAALGLALREAPPSRARLAAVVRLAEAAATDQRAHDPGGHREEFLALAREAAELANATAGR